jgi:hypothetical protein
MDLDAPCPDNENDVEIETASGKTIFARDKIRASLRKFSIPDSVVGDADDILLAKLIRTMSAVMMRPPTEEEVFHFIFGDDAMKQRIIQCRELRG